MAATGSAQGALGILSLGDSYTIGERVDASERWPAQLCTMLAKQGLAVKAPQIIAKTGWTADELEAELDSADDCLIKPPYALTTLLIGVNDQYRGRSVEEFQLSFERLLDRAIGYAGLDPRRLLVLSIPDWGVTPFAAEQGRLGTIVARQIDEYNAVSRQLTEATGADYLDITDLTREAANNPALLTDDGLHPSAIDYQRWARRASERLQAIGWPWANA